MFHRIYAKPFTRCNEAWNFENKYPSTEGPSYKDKLIQGYSNTHKKDKNIFCDFYKKFAIDVVTETVYNYPYAQITEKSIRPIVHKRMFIIVGATGTLGLLQNKGFKTFAPFINEKYDRIEDPHLRMQAIVDELIRISKFSIDDMRNTVLQYKEILQHNYDHYHWLCNHEIEQAVNQL